MKTSLFFVRFQIPSAPMPIASAHVLAGGPASAIVAARMQLRGKVDLDGARCHVSSGLNGDRFLVRQPDEDPFFDRMIGETRLPDGMAVTP